MYKQKVKGTILQQTSVYIYRHIEKGDRKMEEFSAPLLTQISRSSSWYDSLGAQPPLVERHCPVECNNRSGLRPRHNNDDTTCRRDERVA